MARILMNSLAAYKWVGLGAAIRHFGFCIQAACQRNADAIIECIVQLQQFSGEDDHGY